MAHAERLQGISDAHVLVYNIWLTQHLDKRTKGYKLMQRICVRLVQAHKNCHTNNI